MARWTARLGVDAAIAWMRFDNEPAPLTLRALHRRDARRARGAAGRGGRLGDADAGGRPAASWSRTATRSARGAPAGFIVPGRSVPKIVGELAAAWPARRRLDVCAAPGGKTLALWAARGAGQVVAGNRRPRRVRLLREMLGRAGAGDIPIVQHDAAGPLPYRDVFDLVLVDAPCSGLGTLRREPDLKWRRAEAELASMAAVQSRMLAHAARVVAAWRRAGLRDVLERAGRERRGGGRLPRGPSGLRGGRRAARGAGKRRRPPHPGWPPAHVTRAARVPKRSSRPPSRRGAERHVQRLWQNSRLGLDRRVRVRPELPRMEENLGHVALRRIAPDDVVRVGRSPQTTWSPQTTCVPSTTPSSASPHTMWFDPDGRIAPHDVVRVDGHAAEPREAVAPDHVVGPTALGCSEPVTPDDVVAPDDVAGPRDRLALDPGRVADRTRSARAGRPASTG